MSIRLYVEKATISHETVVIGAAVFVIEVSPPRELWALMGRGDGQAEPLASFSTREEAQAAAERLRGQLNAMRPTLQ